MIYMLAPDRHLCTARKKIASCYTFIVLASWPLPFFFKEMGITLQQGFIRLKPAWMMHDKSEEMQAGIWISSFQATVEN